MHKNQTKCDYILIDNYDSFTYNLFHYFEELGANVTVYRNDAISVDEIVKLSPKGIIISPGPATPDEAGICLELVDKCRGKIPILGVCLGHQAIAQALGGKIVRAPYLMHGKTSEINHTGCGVFSALPDRYNATRYHSLIVDKESFPKDQLEITAWADDDLIMGFESSREMLYGVQFHPESIASDQGHALLKNFLDICEARCD